LLPGADNPPRQQRDVSRVGGRKPHRKDGPAAVRSRRGGSPASHEGGPAAGSPGTVRRALVQASRGDGTLTLAFGRKRPPFARGFCERSPLPMGPSPAPAAPRSRCPKIEKNGKSEGAAPRQTAAADIGSFAGRPIRPDQDDRAIFRATKYRGLSLPLPARFACLRRLDSTSFCIPRRSSAGRGAGRKG